MQNTGGGGLVIGSLGGSAALENIHFTSVKAADLWRNAAAGADECVTSFCTVNFKSHNVELN